MLRFKTTLIAFVIYLLMVNAFAVQLEKELLLSVKLNNADLNRIILFLEKDGHLWVDEEEIKTWHIKLPKTKLYSYQNHSFYPLSSLKTISYKLNKKNLSIDISIPTHLFSESEINGYPFEKIIPQPAHWGGFVNYDFNGQSTSTNRQVNALLEAGIFNQYGVLTNTELASIAGSTHKEIRLATTWTKDIPETMHTFRLGDTFTNPGSWGQSVGYGGVQWGTNFATQPYFIPFPLPQFQGVAAIPSSVDVYVNNALISKTNIPSGPFSITNIPTITGQGNVNVVVTDILGRQQIITLPSYGSNSLLKPDLRSESYEVGLLRNNFGTVSNDYGQLFFAATHRVGMNATRTQEWRVELAKDQQTIGIGETLLFNNTLLTNFSTAISRDSSGAGIYGLMSLQHLSMQINYGMNLQVASENFTRLGMLTDNVLPIVQSQWYIGLPIKDTSINFGYTQQINRDQPNTNFVTFTADRTITRGWVMNISGLSNIGGISNKSIFLTLTHAIDDRSTASAGLDWQSQATQGYVQMQRSLPTDTGYGYNLQLIKNSQLDYLNTVSAQNNVGNYYVTAARQAGQVGYQLDVSGAVSVLENHVYFSRSLTNSFGVVSLPGYENVNVYLNNQIIAKTNSSGNAFIPALLPYNKNSVSINPDEIPLNAVIEGTEVSVVPYYRSGVVIHFPVYPAADGMVRIVSKTGEPLPTGVIVKMVGYDKTFPIGENGITYMNHLKEQNHIIAEWGTTHCEFNLPYKKVNEPMPNLGTFICK